MACPTTALTEVEIQEKLKSLSGWEWRQNAIERVYTGKTYLEALEKLNAVARLSEEADHHPDLLLSWKHLQIRYWTHVAGGVTTLDFELALRAEAVLTQ
jgi:4a-hydroxytetrahydrobiopterin dehydratase